VDRTQLHSEREKLETVKSIRYHLFKIIKHVTLICTQTHEMWIGKTDYRNESGWCEKETRTGDGG
jgi:hypothetical protein